MKRYTIIYAHTGQCGSHAFSIPRMDRVETTNLKDLLSQDKYYGYVHFVFEGWPVLEGEFDVPKAKE
jgi:hypothetical protein